METALIIWCCRELDQGLLPDTSLVAETFAVGPNTRRHCYMRMNYTATQFIATGYLSVVRRSKEHRYNNLIVVAYQQDM
jgi:hypothetical protein